MNEDPNLVIKDPVVPAVKQPEVTDSEVQQVAADVESLAISSIPHLVVPPELKNFAEPVLTHNLSKAEEVPGVQQHPPAHSTITGDVISFPDQFDTREGALAASSGKATDGDADAGRVFVRQYLRGRIRVQDALKKAA